MPVNAPTSPLRRVFDQQVARLADEFEAQLIEQSRAELGDSLNQAVRRMRQAEAVPEIFAALVDAAAGLAQGAAALRIEEGRLRPLRIRGVEGEAVERFNELDLPLASAPALAGAVESRDPVVTVASESELSAELRAVLGDVPASRLSVFPVVSAGAAQALLCCWGDLHSGTLELLAQAAGLAIPVEPPPPPPPPPELVAIAIAPPPEVESPAPVAPAEPATPSATGRPGWESLPEEDQHMHLRAQRFARVEAAEIRLRHAEAVHAGRIHRDIYGALRDEIDSARGRFRARFLATCPSMVDYLHIELVRTLANDHLALMGSDFPPPMA